MPERDLECTSHFKRQLRVLVRKRNGLEEAINQFFRRCVQRGPPPGSQKIPHLDGLPVFKDRLGFGNVGKRGGARVIYYCDDGRVVPLFVYVKAKDADIPAHEIRAALAAASLIPAPDPE